MFSRDVLGSARRIRRADALASEDFENGKISTASSFFTDNRKDFAALEIVWNRYPEHGLGVSQKIFRRLFQGGETIPLEENETHKLVAAMASLVESDRNNLVLVEEFLKKEEGKPSKTSQDLNEDEMERTETASFRKTQRNF